MDKDFKTNKSTEVGLNNIEIIRTYLNLGNSKKALKYIINKSNEFRNKLSVICLPSTSQKTVKIVQDSCNSIPRIDLGVNFFSLFNEKLDPNETIFPHLKDIFVEIASDLCDFPDNVFANIEFKETEFEIPIVLYNAALNYVDNNFSTDTNVLNYLIRKLYRQKFNNVCVINFKSSYKTSTKITHYARCAHFTCRKYRFVTNFETDGLKKVSVFVDKENICHMKGFAVCPTLKNIERKLVQDQLQNKSSFQFLEQFVPTCPSGLEKFGRREDFSKSVVKKAKSEAANFQLQSKDSFINLYRQIDNKNVFKIEYPLAVYMCTKEQIITFMEYCQTAFFDATGSFSKKIPQASKAIFLYSIVGHDKIHKNIIPAANFLLSNHAGTDISILFQNLKKFCQNELIPFPFFKEIVVDHSYALLYGIGTSCNNLTTSQYMDYAYDVSIGTKSFDNSLVIIRLDRSHMSKIIVKDGSIQFKNHKVEAEKLYSDSLKALLKFSCLKDIEIWFKHICIVFCSKFKSTEVEDSVLKLQDFVRRAKLVDSDTIRIDYVNTCNTDSCSGPHVIDFNREDFVDDDIFISNNENKLPPNYKNVKFYKHFNEIHLKQLGIIQKYNTNSKDNNIYFHSDILQHILKKYMSEVGISTNLIGKFLKESWRSTESHEIKFLDRKCTVSTGPAEGYNNLIKNHSRGGKKNMSLINSVDTINSLNNYLIAQQTHSHSKKRTSIKRMQKEILEQEAKRRKVSSLVLPLDESIQEENWRGQIVKSLKKSKNLTINSKRVSNVPNLNEFNDIFNSSYDQSFSFDCLDNFPSYSSLILQEHNYFKVAINPSLVDHNYVKNNSESCSIFNSNKTFKDILFYNSKGFLNSNLVIAKFSILKTFYNNAPLGFSSKLKLVDFCTLNKDCELTDTIINICSLIFLYQSLNNNISFIDCNQSTCILNSGKLDDLSLFPKKMCPFLIMPFLVNNNHWVLALVDFNLKRFYYVDSNFCSTTNSNFYFKNFINFIDSADFFKDLNSYNINKWELYNYDCKQQIDNTSCGIFVLLNILTILRSKNLNEFDFMNLEEPDNFRNYLKQYLILNSDDISDFCLCGNRIPNSIVRCEKCQRPFCDNCTKSKKCLLCINLK